MNCVEFLQDLEELSLSGPDFCLPDEHDLHQQTCGRCRDELQRVMDAWMLLPAALEQEAVSQSVESQLLKRIAASPVPSVDRAESRAFVFWKYAVAASVLILLTGGTLIWLNRDSGARIAGGVTQDAILEFERRFESLKQEYSTPEVKFVSLESVTIRRPVYGHLVYDFLANEGHFVSLGWSANLGESHTLWLLDGEGQVVASAPIMTDAASRIGTARIDLPGDRASIREVVVTSAGEDGVASPEQNVRMRTESGL